MRETAECLGVNAATVRTRLFRAQRLLRVELSRRLEGESTEIFDFGAERCDRRGGVRAGTPPALTTATTGALTPAPVLPAGSPASV